MNKIVVTGSLAFDSIKTPYGYREKAMGGAANYFSFSASFFASVGIVGVVGEDYPKEYLNLLSRATVDTSGIIVASGKTFFWAGEYDDNLSEAKTLTTHLNVFSNFNPVLPEHYRDVGYLFLANIDPDLQWNVLNQIQGTPFVGLDTMNYWITRKQEALLRVLKRVDLLTINETEALLLSSRRNLVEASRVILDMGPKALIVKRGEYGAVLFFGDEVFYAPAYPLEIVADPTGAGDTFAGGVMGYLAQTRSRLNSTSLRKAMVYGTVMASFVVENFSFDRLITLTGEDIQKRYKHLENMTFFHSEEGEFVPYRNSSTHIPWNTEFFPAAV